MVTRAGHRYSSATEIEDRALHRHEHASGILLGQLVVEPAQDLRRILVQAGHRAQQGQGHAHEQRRRNPLAGDVSQRNDHSVAHADHVVQIASHELRGFDDCSDVQSRALRERAQVRLEQPHLDLARNPQIARVRLSDASAYAFARSSERTRACTSNGSNGLVT